MIIPLRSPDGLPDIARLDEWATVCDRCADRQPLGVASRTWLIGQRTGSAVYCPPCITPIAAELIGAVFPPPKRRWLVRFVAALGRRPWPTGEEGSR